MPRPPETARSVSLRALREIDEKEAFANQALDAALDRSALQGRDRGLATELVYGVTRRRATLDWLIARASARPLAKIDPWTRNILRQAVYQLLYLERIPQSAVVHEAVELARRFGHEGLAKFVNGVLRGLLRQMPLELPAAEGPDPAGALAVRHSYPEWLARQWVDRYGLAEAVRLLEAGNAVPPLTLRANRLKVTREQLLEALQAEGLTCRPTLLSPHGVVVADTGGKQLEQLKAYRQGFFLVQDESSMLVAPVVDPRPGMLVLDLAAAPGGKATHLAELMQNRGQVIALDIHPHKVEMIDENARRLGIAIIQTVAIDARLAGRHFAERADAVLCDVPCSGLGTLARRADLRWRKEAADLAALVPLQREILASAAQAVRPGGILVYSTCTIGPAENEEVVESFLAGRPDFAPDPIEPYLPEGLESEGAWVRLLPHRHGTDGFFIARLRRAR
jgi:16S rRNA (cytosine967-C5)-methyltransferase